MVGAFGAVVTSLAQIVLLLSRYDLRLLQTAKCRNQFPVGPQSMLGKNMLSQGTVQELAFQQGDEPYVLAEAVYGLDFRQILCRSAQALHPHRARDPLLRI